MTKMGNNRVLGDRGEQNVRCDLSMKGYVVATNDECDKADLTARKYVNDGNSPSEYFGLQCKYAGSDTNTYTVSLQTISGGQKNERTEAEYKVGDFEVFGIDCTENFGKVLYIPQSLVRLCPDKKLAVRITPTINGDMHSPFWCAWDFLSVEKASTCKDGSEYRQVFSGVNNDGDKLFIRQWEDLEKYIQFQWERLRKNSPYKNGLIEIISPTEYQYPLWFRANHIGSKIWEYFGEEPEVSPTQVRSSNSKKYVRKDLQCVPSPTIFETAEKYVFFS